MGELLGEDTGQTPLCPICGTSLAKGCDHLLASLDLTFGECNGGYCYDRLGEFESRIQEAFAERLQAGRAKRLLKWKDDRIQELWDALEPGDPPESPEDVYLDQYSLCASLLTCSRRRAASATWGPPSRRGAGMSFSLELLFAQDPKATHAAAVELPKAWLHRAES